MSNKQRLTFSDHELIMLEAALDERVKYLNNKVLNLISEGLSQPAQTARKKALDYEEIRDRIQIAYLKLKENEND